MERRRHMEMNGILRRLRGALGNALVWGGGWFLGSLAIFGTVSLTGIASASLGDALNLALRAGIIGGVAGGVFSTAVGLLYRGRRISELSWVRFGIGGAVLTGVFVPLFLQSMNLLSGTGLVPWELVLDDALLTAVFGGTVAGGSLKAAQMADRSLPSPDADEIGASDAPEVLAPSSGGSGP